MSRTKRINFWLGDKDLAKLERKSKEVKMSHSDYIRKLICEAEVLPTPDVDYIAYADEFKRLGRIFNSYVKEYSTTGFLNREASEAVWQEIKETVDRLRKELIDKTVKLEVRTTRGKK